MTALAMLMLVTVAGTAGSDAVVVQAMQAHEALVAVTARTSALLCPGVEVDEAAVRQRMEMAGITDADIMSPSRFGPQAEAAARSFKQSLADDPTFCDAILNELDGRLHLVRRRR